MFLLVLSFSISLSKSVKPKNEYDVRLNKRNVLVSKIAFILAIIVFLVYVICGINETINLSSRTVDIAFEKFLKTDFKTNYQSLQNEDFVNKKVYRTKKFAVVPFEVGNQVSIVVFQKGLFGWKMMEFSHNQQSLGYSYSSDSPLIYGIIPENLASKTHILKVNGKEAKIIKLNQKTKVWLFINKDLKQLRESNTIRLLDYNGNVISNSNL
jgi:hypothetical protein